MLTELQKRKLMRMFDAFDYDKDGFLEQEDFAGTAVNLANAFDMEVDSSAYAQLQQTLLGNWQQIQQFAGAGRDQVDPESWFNYYDSLFSSQETTSAYLNAYIDGFYALWDLIDPAAKGQGTTLQRFKSMYRAYNLDETVGEAAFRRMDTNGNGVLDRDEMYDRTMEFYGSDPDAPGNWMFGPY
jgi:Ca2+-binding EF-hand superfamily protein